MSSATPQHSITAQIDTFLKKSELPASELRDDQKRRVAPGTTYPVFEYQQESNFHWKVKLADQVWMIFDGGSEGKHSHWNCSWEDKQENELQNTFDVVSTKPKDSFIGRELTPGMSFSTRITQHITYGEFCKYQDERRFTQKYQCETAYELALFLEQCRAQFGGNALVITSGNRPGPVNAKVGGSKMSEHLFDQPHKGAVDFYIKNIPIHQVQDYCDREWDWSVGLGAKRGFVHLGKRTKAPKRIRWPY